MNVIDLFCGAGGFSEGIIQAGLNIVFSSDRSEHVMGTYVNRHEQLGLHEGVNTHFELADIRELDENLILNKINELEIFKENPLHEIDAIFGGPPCQGFSLAGNRNSKDARNMLFREYLRIIYHLKPKYVVMENVTGFMSMEINPDFKSFSNNTYPEHTLVPNVLRTELESFGYTVLEPRILNAADFGVPQRRERAIFLAYRSDVTPIKYPEPNPDHRITVEDAILNENSKYAISLSQGRTPRVSKKQGISANVHDFNTELSIHSKVILERFSLFQEGDRTDNVVTRIKENGIRLEEYPNLEFDCLLAVNNEYNGKVLEVFLNANSTIKLKYSEKGSYTLAFDQLKRKIIKYWKYTVEELFSRKSIINDIDKLINIHDFINTLEHCKLNWNKECTLTQLRKKFSHPYAINIEQKYILALMTKKNNRMRLNSLSQAPTVVTLPDDFIHPTKNRTMSVRELARLQSFDDSFVFLGKRTTGGENRQVEVPQYTQVGNAVPPLLAKSIAIEVKNALLKTKLTKSETAVI